MAILKLKSKGKDVEALQKSLNKNISAKLELDGDFGNLTKKAVIKFQKKNSLKPDGIAGSSTLAVIGLGPSLRIPKMKVKDSKEELRFYKGKSSLQSTGGPEHIGREMVAIRVGLRQIEATFEAMVREVNTIQKDVVKHHTVALAALEKVVKHQADYAGFVKKNDVNKAADMALNAEEHFKIFEKASKAFGAAQKMQSEILLGRCHKLIDKTFG
ncbi:MAG: peptidoglycan-binding protein [Rhodobacteraceae bacterium]|nr:peptidoglycan-binding protein [Paracoccaceae bacterium]